MYNTCSFTQTYGDDREILFKLRKENKLDHQFRNNFKANIFSFHNSSDEYVEHINEKYLKPYYDNLIILKQNEITYPLCVKNAIKCMKNLEADSIFFCQDDGFCVTKSYDLLKSSIDLFYEKDLKMLHVDNCDPNVTGCCDVERKFERDGLTIWYNDIQTVIDKLGEACMGDSPYIANIDYLLDRFYDDKYFLMNDVWKAEVHIYTKSYKLNTVRYQTEQTLYHNINVVGSNAMKHYTHEKIVNDLLLFLGDKND
jgi:hypothetical protein